MQVVILATIPAYTLKLAPQLLVATASWHTYSTRPNATVRDKVDAWHGRRCARKFLVCVFCKLRNSV